MSTSAATRPPVTRVPLSDAMLPPVDMSTPPWPGRDETVGGVTLHVRRTPGPADADTTAVYVHGLGGSATNWTDLAGQLAGHVPGVALDLPGFGHTEPPPGFDYTIPAHADVVARYIRGLGVGPVHLFGNSMGGAISVLVAARHPELVRDLVLVSPAMPDLRPWLSRISDPRLPLAYLPLVGTFVRRRLAAEDTQVRVMRLLRLCFAEPDRIPLSRREEAAREIVEREAMAWANPALARSTVGLIRSWLVPPSRSLWTLTPRIDVPTLVVWGTEDKLVTVRKAPRTAELLPRGRLLVLPRTGHVAQMERPATVARATLGMWEQVAAGTW
ncbi:alpha/beta hydrolase [Actinophytocola xinjiangensis]|uniref:Alpha/beta hydrolase n=1 Tax=Actinophytocola xinjiangensis TaxID=485602 RepID=A0A7Z0WP92_9PSEU|nr:alpha/beta hydrolase [Actinophytocola xinjiangensis]OLF10936.1 alpha/beta hydrolase [Actinophytocola xinjiangensis]